MLVSSHVLSEVQQLVDQVVILHHGRLVRQGTLAELADRQTWVSVRTHTPTGSWPHSPAPAWTERGSSTPDPTSCGSPAWPPPKSAASPSLRRSSCTNSAPSTATSSRPS